MHGHSNVYACLQGLLISTTVYLVTWGLRERAYRRDDPGRLHVWVGGVSSEAGEAQVLATLSEAGAPVPAHVLRVAGVDRGVILQFPSVEDVVPAVQVLNHKLQLQQQVFPPMPRGPDLGPPAEPMEPNLPRRSLSPAGSLRHGAASPPPPTTLAILQPEIEIPPYANRSLWVGQVSPHPNGWLYCRILPWALLSLGLLGFFQPPVQVPSHLSSSKGERLSGCRLCFQRQLSQRHAGFQSTVKVCGT